MKQLPKDSASLLSQLRDIETFRNLKDEALLWLIDKSDYLQYEEGEVMFRQGEKADYMLIFLEGEILVRLERGGKTREVGTFTTSTITGVLPFSRMKENGAESIVYQQARILRLHRDYFVEMVNVSYSLTQALVAVMSTRIRDFTQLRFQDEKLMALGKLSAGLAHELNNPAAAMVRSSEELYKQIHSTPEKFKSVITLHITPEQTDQINAVLFSKIQNKDRKRLSLMKREEEMDEMIDWLEDNGVEDADEMAETFVDYELKPEDCDMILDIVGEEGLSTLLWWVESTLNLEKLVEEIRESADRIASLIKSIKGYSHMDRASTFGATDIHEGLASTVTMLKHEFKTRRIQLNKQFGDNLPLVHANPGELNQVWTNIIVNALQAMDADGTLTLRSYLRHNTVCVDISDNGPGIPEDIQTRIFEPFFTTKAMDEGTGMGLDIVKKIIDRHHAEIKLESEPGKTTFTVCFPIDSQS